jgi:drug/metabolite transporter (DMT)-like permease
VLLGERIGPLTLAGGAIVLVGLWLVEHPGGSGAQARLPSNARPARP